MLERERECGREQGGTGQQLLGVNSSLQRPAVIGLPTSARSQQVHSPADSHPVQGSYPSFYVCNSKYFARALYIHSAERGVWNAPCNARRYICRGEILLCPPDKWVDKPGREENSAKHSGQVGRAGNITFPYSGRVWNCLGTSSARVAMWPLNRRSGVMILSEATSAFAY